MNKIISLVLVLFALSVFGDNYVRTQKDVTVNSTSTLQVPANQARTHLLIQDKDTTNSIYLKFTSVQTGSTEGVQIPPGGNWDMYGAPRDAVFLKAPNPSPSASPLTATVTIIEDN